jgi:hypothetical protein
MAREFKDEQGRAWTVHISCSSLKKIQASAGFDFADISNGKAIDMFGGNSTHLLDVAWPLVKADAEKRGIDLESFGDGLRGDAVAEAIAVLKEELLSFFPSTRRLLMKRLLDRMEVIVSQQVEKAVKDIDSVQLDTVNGGMLPIKPQASLESTPTIGVSGNS